MDTVPIARDDNPTDRTPAQSASSLRATALSAYGEPYLWGLGGALALGVLMIVGLLFLVFWNGIATFYPKPIAEIRLTDGATIIAGEPIRSELYRPAADERGRMSPEAQRAMDAADGHANRTLYRIGNYDLYNEDFSWVSDHTVASVAHPADYHFVERLEWGPLIGRIKTATLSGQSRSAADLDRAVLDQAHDRARARWARIRELERDGIGAINHELEAERLHVRKVALTDGEGSSEHRRATDELATRSVELQAQYQRLVGEANALKAENARNEIVFADVTGREIKVPLAGIVRMYPANALNVFQAIGVYLSRWWEFLSDEPREANTEGGVLPAIFGTFAMTLLLVVAVTPFGVITALYLREYAKQGRLVAAVRISVNNLAGVPSIVYGVFGLGFFAYLVGGSIDAWFFQERLPSPTFGTGGLLWSSLTLAILTVPVVIVASEEALAAVPLSVREGSLACGASKWQTIRRVVLPQAMPGIMTGVILAMARGAGEVAPLMLVGVVKLAPELPIDGIFPFLHLERSFMHLGFHIYDVGFQSRNSEAGKPMVFVTTLLLITLVASMNAFAIVVRNRLKKRFAGAQF
ncbi:MAG: phosphate ABC transporter permease PstA [Rhodospirillales bacterium]|nr:phosphate ABC transporter permease PstA [Rhodospirillales bacterium]